MAKFLRSKREFHVSWNNTTHNRDGRHTDVGESMYHGGPAVACCTFSRCSSAFGPTISVTRICHSDIA